MSAPRRDLARRRRRADARLEVEFETESFRLWLPDPDDPMVIADFAEAAALAADGMRVKDACAAVIDAHPGAPSRRELYDAVLRARAADQDS